MIAFTSPRGQIEVRFVNGPPLSDNEWGWFESLSRRREYVEQRRHAANGQTRKVEGEQR